MKEREMYTVKEKIMEGNNVLGERERESKEERERTIKTE